MKYSAQEYWIILYVFLFCFVCLVVQSDALVNPLLPSSRYIGLAAPPVFNPFSNGLSNNPYINGFSFSFPSLWCNYSSHGLNGTYFNTPPAITPGSRVWNQNQDYSGLSVNSPELANIFGSMSEQLLSQGVLFPGIGFGGGESLWSGLSGIGMPGLGLPGLGFPGIGASGLGLSGLGFPGLGIPGLGLLGVSGVGFPGIGIPGLGFSGLGFPGIGASGLGLSGLGFPGLGILGPGLSEIGYPGITLTGTWPEIGGSSIESTQISPFNIFDPFGALISELSLEELPEYLINMIPTLPIIPPLDLSIPMVDLRSQMYVGARLEGMSQTIYILLMDNGNASVLPLTDILSEGIYCIKMNNGSGAKTSFNIYCGDACYTLSLYLEINLLSPIWAWDVKWW